MRTRPPSETLERMRHVQLGPPSQARTKPSIVSMCMLCPPPSWTQCNIDCNRLHLVCPRCLAERRGFCCESCNDAPRRRPLDLLAARDENGQFDFKAAIAATQGPLPGQADPNKLVNVKPANVPRKLWDADVHGTR